VTDEKSTPADTCKVYLVRRRRENCYLRTDWSGSRRLPGKRNVRIFHTYDEACTFAEELNSGKLPSPADANPFLSYCEGFDGRIGGYGHISEEAEPDLIALIRSFGFEPPSKHEIEPRHDPSFVERDWYAWWEEHASKLTAEQRASIWQKLNEDHWFYEVVELALHVPPDDPLYSSSASP
jgi:hypothetical protein